MLLFDPAQIARLQAIAESQGRSVGALIREAVDQAYLNGDRARRLSAVERMAHLNLPVASWEQMERESTGRYGDG